MFWCLIVVLLVVLVAWLLRRRPAAAARRRATTAPEMLGWRKFLLMGPPQPKGQAALVDLGIEVGEDLVAGDTTYRVAELDSLEGHGQRRAWLVNVTESHRSRIRAMVRDQLAAELEVQLHDLVLEAVRPIFGRRATEDVPSIATYWVAKAIGDEAGRLTWERCEVRGAADLPRDVLPQVEIVGEAVRWDVKPLARWMAERVRDYG